MSATFDPTAIIAAWQAAYRAANSFEPTAQVEYKRGWFCFRESWGFKRRRRFEVVEMTERLLARKAES